MKPRAIKLTRYIERKSVDRNGLEDFITMITSKKVETRREAQDTRSRAQKALNQMAPPGSFPTVFN